VNERAERIFEQSLALDSEERAAFVDNECRGQPRLREEVLALLTDAEDADKFFDRLDEAVFSSPPSASGGVPYPDTSSIPEFTEGDNIGHYRIESLIGRGGMGAVYRAYDTRLNRDVALKFLPPHLGTEPEEQARLLAEARAAAALDHPNVCSIHEVGETADGRFFIAMPCYNGETLKERLKRERLSVEESVVIAAQIARGLAAAHSHGIVHRDVKPGNVIIVSDGTVRLLDFGLAVAMNASLMKSGITPGTVAYMSPEQIRGTELSSRTDLWSLGVVLYEMLTGGRPFNGPNHRAIIRAILHDEPEPIAKRCPGVTPTLAKIVERLLQKDPDKRYEAGAEVVSDLQHEAQSLAGAARGSLFRRKSMLVATSALIVVALAGILSWRNFRDSGAFKSRTDRAQPSIAVLPLANLSADTADAALARGITEELIARLATAGDVRVIASTSVAGLKRGEMDIRQIADSLGVANVLEGGIQKVGSQVRVQVRLVDGQDGATRWSQSYDREFKDVFAVQDAIVAAVAGELEMRFDRDRQFVRHRTRNIQAYELYLRGSDPVLLRGQSGIWKAQDYFQKAIAADSTYAAAHAGLALVYVRRARNASDPGMPVPQLLALAQAEAIKAIKFDSTLAEGHYALGRVLEAVLDFPHAEASIRHAIQLDPNRSVYRRSLSYMKAWSGRPGEELAEAQRALETDPLNPYAIAAVASGLYGSHRYDESLALNEKLTTIKPPLQGVSFGIAQLYAKKGMMDRAIATLRPGAEAGDPLFTALLGNMLARTGKADEANRILADLQARREKTGVGAFHIAMVYAGFGDLDQTFAWLNKSIDDRSIVSFIMGPTFEELRSDPRFNLLRRRLGLASIQ
jgi:serine/threonine-protein kinase